MAVNLGVIIYVVLQLIAFVFVMIGTGVDIFYIKRDARGGEKECITLWGQKDNCSKFKLNSPAAGFWARCPGILTNFRVAQAFAIISIFVYGFAFLFGCLLLCCCTGFRWLCLALNIVGAVTACVVWALMVVTYRIKDPNCEELSIAYNFGTGFGLILCAWVLDIFNIISLMLPWQLGQSVGDAALAGTGAPTTLPSGTPARRPFAKRERERGSEGMARPPPGPDGDRGNATERGGEGGEGCAESRVGRDGSA